MWQNTSKGNGGADQGVEFFVSANGQLQVARGNALDFEVLCGILLIVLAYIMQTENSTTYSCKFKNFGGEVFEDSRDVHGCFSSHAHLVLGVVLQETLDTTAGELQKVGVSKGDLSVNARKTMLGL
jgi:hypothetical protein